MKYFHIVICLSFLFSCRLGNESKSLLNKDNLESSFVSIDHTKDTTIHTAKGGIISIEAGTFDKDVELEIKEAYTLNDMLQAGLTTTSNGELLQSGGMIYINTKDDSELEPKKPIQVSIPTLAEEGMQLFKGEETENAINWRPVDTLKPGESELVAAGRVLFNNSCSSCHGINKKLSAPAMAGVEKRGPWTLKANIYKYIQNPGAFTPTTSYTKKLVAEYGSLMPSFPQFTESGIDAILTFIKSEEKKSKNDPTAYDNLSKSFRRMSYPKDSSTYLLPDRMFVTDTMGFEGHTESAIDTTDASYQFEMKTPGWYNIDSFLGQENAPECTLNIKANGVNNNQKTEVYFIIPKRKVVTRADLDNDGLYYLFGKRKVQLYPNDAAMIIAFSEEGDFYFGQTNFTVQKQNQIQVQLKPTTKEKFMEWLKTTKW